jgi:SpoVK/Ycf46/Vps4 family AAA+-type ATPase
VQPAVYRYSNMDVNVLLQLLERFEGTAVLTTNLRRSIDTAFERRIMFKVRFERPDVEQRRRIWMLMLPSSIPTGEAIDYDRLARLDLAGGEIKNAVLRAAYAAAREGGELLMRHLQDAAAHEAAATGRVYFDASGHG